jgi:hypothetical protein
MPAFTVIGLHDGGETFALAQDAHDPHHAIREVARTKSYADAEILGAIECTGTWTASCEDSGMSAFVADLVDDEDDELKLCNTEGCGNSLDDGEGFDGKCGSCADKGFQEEDKDDGE